MNPVILLCKEDLDKLNENKPMIIPIEAFAKSKSMPDNHVILVFTTGEKIKSWKRRRFRMGPISQLHRLNPMFDINKD